MKTLVLGIRPEEASEHHPAIRQCAEILKRGGLVAMPTETVYGLAANALDPEAVARVFVAKDRPAWDPMIVHIGSLEMLSQIALGLPPQVQLLADRFWPGPLSLLLKKSPQLPAVVSAGRETVAVRMPAHPVALALITATGLPVAAPSANRFGRISPTTADHVLRDLDGRVEAVLDAGSTKVGVESTVLDPLHAPPLLLRPGGVTREQLEAVLGPIELYVAPLGQPPEALASPGLAARHYAPEARLVLVEGRRDALIEALRCQVQIEGERGEYAGIMLPDGWLDEQMLAIGGLVIFDWGRWGEWELLAQRLYAGLRYLDKPGVSVIVCPLPPEQGLGLALRDRLMKAAR